MPLVWLSCAGQTIKRRVLHAQQRGAVMGWHISRDRAAARSLLGLTDAFPGLAPAEQAAEGPALNPQGIRSLHRDIGVVRLAAVGIVDPTGPFRVGRLH